MTGTDRRRAARGPIRPPSTAAQAEEGGYASEGHLRELGEEMARTGRAVVAEVKEVGEKRHIRAWCSDPCYVPQTGG